MAIGSLAGVVPRLRGVALVSHGAMSDAELLEQFIARHDEAAFEVMVRRHGPMVFAVCRRVLRHTQDSEDAFQATFLVLAHKAATVTPRNKLAGWLHGVAHRTALKARQRAARRAEVEKNVPARGPDAMNPDTNSDEVEALLDQELSALPDRYRLPIILCDLEGRLRSDVAGTLGCSEGTLSSRLTRGRRLLADRLTRRGVRLSGAAIALMLAERSALAEPLIRATVPVALSASAGGAVSPSVADLATGVMKSMFLKKLQAVAVAALAVAALALPAFTGLPGDRVEAAPVPKGAADAKGNDELPPDLNGRLLMNRKVLKDMKCDFDQFDKIMDALEAADRKASETTREAMMQLKFNAPGNPAAFEQMIKGAREEGEKEFRKAVDGVTKAVLTPAQRSRLRQIDLQARGPEAFTTPAVVKALDLTAKQKDELAANAKKVEEDIAQAMQQPGVVGGVIQFNGAGGGGGGGPIPAGRGQVVINGANAATDYEKVVKDTRAEGMKRALAVLTEEQAATWKKLVGEPFPYPLNPAAKLSGLTVGGVMRGTVPLPPLPAGGAVVPGNVVPVKPIVPPPINPE